MSPLPRDNPVETPQESIPGRCSCADVQEDSLAYTWRTSGVRSRCEAHYGTVSAAQKADVGLMGFKGLTPGRTITRDDYAFDRQRNASEAYPDCDIDQAGP